MSQSTGERFALTARPPVRALAIAAVTTLLGAVLMVLAQARDLGIVLLIIGSALLVFGLTLGLLAIMLVARLRSTVVLDGDGAPWSGAVAARAWRGQRSTTSTSTGRG